MSAPNIIVRVGVKSIKTLPITPTWRKRDTRKFYEDGLFTHILKISICESRIQANLCIPIIGAECATNSCADTSLM
jgi:hypothetical protein